MATTPEAAWQLIAGITRMGDWSPETTSAEWAGWAYEFAPAGSGCLVTELWEDHRSALMTWLSPMIRGTKDRPRRNKETMTVTLERLAAAAERA